MKKNGHEVFLEGKTASVENYCFSAVPYIHIHNINATCMLSNSYKPCYVPKYCYWTGIGHFLPKTCCYGKKWYQCITKQHTQTRTHKHTCTCTCTTYTQTHIQTHTLTNRRIFSMILSNAFNTVKYSINLLARP